MSDVAEEDEVSIDHVGYSVSEEENGIEQVQYNIDVIRYNQFFLLSSGRKRRKRRMISTRN